MDGKAEGSRIFRSGTFFAVGQFAVGHFAIGQFTVGDFAVGTSKNIQGLDIFLMIGGT